MDEVEKIRQEIKRLKSTNPSEYNHQNAEGYIWALDDLLSFLDTLEEEPDKSLEEEIRRYLREECSSDDEPATSETARHFAEWQKEQMLKDAVEGFIFQSEDYYPKELISRYNGDLKHGDKVKLIIVKEDEK